MARIGFLNVCHEDYICDMASIMADAAVKGLEARGIEICVYPEPLVNPVQAVKAGKELIRQDVDGVILFLGTWIECPVAMAAIREIEHLPMCLWGFPMFMESGKMGSTGSYVSFAMFKGVMDRVQYKYKAVLGLPDDPEAIDRAASFCTAAGCAGKLKRMRIGLVGYTSMSIYPGTFDHVFLRFKIGPEVEQLDSYTLINAAERIRDEDCTDVLGFIKSQTRIRTDVEEDDLLKVSKLFLAMRKLCTERVFNCINVKCQYEFSKEYGMVMCVPLSILAEYGVVSSCEGDMLNTVSMAILNLLAGTMVTYGDAINHEGNVVKLSSCGFIPFSMGVPEDREIRKFLPHPGFSGIQNSFVLKPGRVTVMRLVEDKCDYHILYFTGEGQKTGLRQEYMPALDVRLDGDINRLLENYSGQHFAICYGDVSAEIEDLARILNIKTIRI